MRDPDFRNLVEAWDQNKSGPDRDRHFQRMFEPAMLVWLAGSPAIPGMESWQEFHARVERGIRRMTDGESRGRRIVAFTSGGPIGVTVQLAMQAPQRSGLEVNWRVRNCSLTGIVFSRDRFTLDTFNAIPHLDDPALWTYR